MRLALLVVLIWLLVPDWMGEPRNVRLHGRSAPIAVARVPLDAGDPARVRLGSLTYLGGVHLASEEPAFGGYSSLTVRGARFLLLADGGMTLGFAMGADFRPRGFAFGELPAGPGSGWSKADRDSESMAVDAATGTAWVGFERANAIWRYAPALRRAERHIDPPAMAGWRDNGGPESMARLADGAFIVLSETSRAPGGGGLAGLRFDRDPTDPKATSYAFAFRPPAGYSPTDAAQLDSRHLLVLTRKVSLRGRGFTSQLLLVDLAAIRPRARVAGRVIATLAPPLIHDNFEGLAVTREGGTTIVWLVSDDNGPSWFQRTLLLKFRLEMPQSKRRAEGTRRGV